MRVLVIEDDQEMASTVAAGLRHAEMAVDVALDGPGGLERALVSDYDVIVLDRDLPGLHGDDVCARLVATGCRSRILMLTAAAATEDLVDGLSLGADDYLPKPFDFPVLVARIGALFRRAQPPSRRSCAAATWWWTPRGAGPGEQAGRSTWRRRSSACWSCCWPPGAGRYRRKSCWNGRGTRTRTRSPPR